MNDYSLPKAVDFNNLSAKAQKAVEYAGRILQPKWDGCALIVRYDVTTDKAEAISASGKPVLSCQHLVDQIVRATTHARSFTACAEVWNADMDFQDINGAFRRKSHQPHLEARWFDFCYAEHEHMRYTARTAWMQESLGLHFAGHRIASSEAEAWMCAKAYAALGGFDGAILREDGPFVLGRSKGDILKLKPLIEHDLEVIGFDERVGERTGRATLALLCRWKNNGVQRVATGLTHEQQRNPGQFLGKIIAVRGMGYTTDGYMREPRFAGVRYDKLKADF